MKVIGLIGGMSWESSAEYYRLINEAVKNRLGGFHSAKILMYSVDFAEIEALQMQDRWEEAGDILADAAKRLENGGADLIALCTNTMHKLSDRIENSVNIPFIHIADAASTEIISQGLTKIGLLGTRFTMEQDFYRARLESQGLKVLIPEKADRDTVHNIIYDELVLGIISTESKKKYQEIIDRLKDVGAEGVILGCTEIGLLIKPEDSSIPVFDTTVIHAQKTAETAVEG